MQINDLTTATELSADDLFPIWDVTDKDTRKVTMLTLSGIAVQLGGIVTVYSDYAAAVAAKPHAVLANIGVMSNGEVMTYVRDATGTALTTADGQKWSPATTAHVGHWGAVGDGVANDRLPIQQATNWVAQRGGGNLRFADRNYQVGSPILRSPKVRYIGEGATAFLEPTNLAAASSGDKSLYLPLLGTRITADRSGTWATRRGVVETVNSTAFLVTDAGMENITVDANEIAEHAIRCVGTSGANFLRVGAGWSKVADWVCGPGAAGEKVPFTQAKFDNCWVISTGRLYAGSAANFIGGFLFWGDARRLAADLIEVFSNANQCQMSGCFVRVPAGYGYVFEDSDDFKLMGGTGSIYFPSVDTEVYSTKSVSQSNNYCARHHTIVGHQGSITADAALTVDGRAVSSCFIVVSSGNSVNVTMGSNKKSVPAQALAGNVINGATTTLPYPTGTTQADYVASHISLDGSVWIDAAEYVANKAGILDVEVTFDPTNIKITNNSGVTWTAGQQIRLDRIYTLWDVPRLVIQRTGNSGGLTEETGGQYGGAPVGVLLNRNSNFTVASGVNVMLPWTTAQFENGLEFWSASEPTKIIVPRGVSYMEFAANCTWEAGPEADNTWDPSTSQLRELHIVKNGYGTVGMAKSQTPGSGGGTNLNCFHACVPVKEGDFFEVRVMQTSGIDLAVTFNPATWFYGRAW